MAQIKDIGDKWALIIDETAPIVDYIDEPVKGYWAEIAEDPETGKHFVSKVTYDKSKHELSTLIKNVDALKNCSKCQALDKAKLDLSVVDIPTSSYIEDSTTEPTPTPTFVSPAMKAITPTPSYTQKAEDTTTSSDKAKSKFQNMFANVFFDAYLTNPGKFFIGTLLGDDTLIESAYPQDQEGMTQFMNEMIDFLAGEVDFVRTPEQAKEFMSVMNKKEEDDNTTLTSGRVKSKSKIPQGAMIIY